MTARETCSECGAAIALDSPGGFCIECLLKLGLGEVESAKCGVQNKEAAKEPQNSERSVRNRGKKQAQPEEGRTGRLLTDEPNDTIGRYRLLQEIGHGGCGVVYLAEQEEPVRRRIALKGIKLGMDTRQVVARFEAERQALALMDHPNIAKVLDAGATASGRPYFVMELV